MKKFEAFDILFVSHLDTLKKELELYTNEADIWKIQGDVNNAPGTLVLHLCGNLKHNIGAIIGKNGFVRKRDEEFSKRDVPKAELIKEIEETQAIIEPILKNLTPEDLVKPFDSDQFNMEDSQVNIAWVMSRLAIHLGYHLGQINYHRRLLFSN